MSDETASGETDERQRKQLRRVGYGIAVSGILTALVALVSTNPGPIVVYGLLAVAIGTFVLESIEGGSAGGLSLGLLVGSFGGWLWPRIDGGSYLALGGTLVVVGLVNAAVTPYFRELGERLAGR
jgi:hypothetical protein